MASRSSARPESLPGILGSVTVTAIAMIAMSAMAGAGLGDMAIRCGYERYETQVISVIQLAREFFTRRLDHRH
ncbi:D-methionine transport system permease protein [Paraburkholderia silvatlantica]|uniref:D-methionine transport system permease protein n=1 Tax=Paraburkholderia silvatlantica TaxID=321895 RepID=A0A2U1AMZ2_9BURK|nr:D-methionine transport system permease protein [Paraburkholderia silvatlantica]PVY37697.1 hypothetical protein C7411_101314 [Paraburkholderia silvatlantica]PXW42660.1 hypothetical protein C7413_101315 [Paraburkholderia silvatlantica]PYE14089.1 hypothetical protein C7410_14122 [Paraburkholderia silvatlantica]TDR04920.1 hypothetical protein C7412_101165 [Paraburkholderia silvatlantica]